MRNPKSCGKTLAGRKSGKLCRPLFRQLYTVQKTLAYPQAERVQLVTAMLPHITAGEITLATAALVFAKTAIDCVAPLFKKNSKSVVQRGSTWFKKNDSLVS